MSVEPSLLQEIIDGASMVIFALMTWLGKTLWSIVKEIQSQLTQLRIDIPTIYSRKDDVKDLFSRNTAEHQRIFERLDRKVDRE